MERQEEIRRQAYRRLEEEEASLAQTARLTELFASLPDTAIDKDVKDGNPLKDARYTRLVLRWVRRASDLSEIDPICVGIPLGCAAARATAASRWRYLEPKRYDWTTDLHKSNDIPFKLQTYLGLHASDTAHWPAPAGLERIPTPTVAAKTDFVWTFDSR